MKNNETMKSFVFLVSACLIGLLCLIGGVVIYEAYQEGAHLSNGNPEPGEQEVSYIETKIAQAKKDSVQQYRVLCRQSPSGKVYYSGDVVDLNDFLGQFDPDTDWNYTEGDEYTDSVLVYYGVYWDSKINKWRIK